MTSKAILVVEDVELERVALVAMLENLGYQTIACAYGHSAITTMREKHDHVCAVLLDINMPAIDGINVLSNIKSNYPAIPVVIVSSTEYEGDHKKIEELGASAFIKKPADTLKLEATLKQLLAA